MQVLLCAAGTVGDVHPLVGIAAAMSSRGHEVVLLANAAYSELAGEAGIRFEQVGSTDELDALRNHPQAWTYAHGWKLWIQGAGLAPMRALYETITRLHRPGESVLAASYLCFGARIAQEKLGIPTATLHLNVHTIRTIHHVYAYPPPPFLPDILPRGYLLPQWTPEWYRRFHLRNSDLFFIDPLMAGTINRLRDDLGLPRLQQYVREWWNSPDLAIGLYPDWWAGRHPDWPDQVVTTGFPFWDRSDAVEFDPALQQFLQADDQVVVFSPGSTGSHSDSHFRAFADVCDRLACRGIVITRKPPPNTIDPERVRFEQYVPFGKLLPHVAAVVHHAGIGTSAQCLAAGVPQVVIPTLYNQPDTATRLERLGVARQIPPRRLTANRLHRALQHVLTSPSVTSNCRDYSQRIHSADALSEICCRLESLV